MTDHLCTTDDVSAQLLRPLTTDETPFVWQLIQSATALLRNAAPSVDTRLARFAADPTDRTALDPVTVATVVAGVVKRYMRNPEGIAAQGVGPFSVTYALRTEKEARGVLQITATDLAVLFPNRKRLRAGTIRTRAGLAPRPVGHYGPIPDVAQVVNAVTDWSAQPPVDGSEFVEFLPSLGPDGTSA
ncbi:MAG: hypothetical protein JWO67_4176 [Streptosporangiaceae bacterium]|nr:hypothetical protein [Streptosporangiaceae bacterium]